MKYIILVSILYYFSGVESSTADTTYSIDAVSICSQYSASTCLNQNQKNTIKETEAFAVEIVLKSNNPNLLRDQIQAIQLEAGEISTACARSASTISDCPSGSHQEWKTMYENPAPATGNVLQLLKSSTLTKQLTNKHLTFKNNVRPQPVYVFDKPQKPGHTKPDVKPGPLPDNSLKPPYYFRFRLENLQFPDWVWGLRVGVYEREGGRQLSTEYKVRF